MTHEENLAYRPPGPEADGQGQGLFLSGSCSSRWPSSSFSATCTRAARPTPRPRSRCSTRTRGAGEPISSKSSKSPGIELTVVATAPAEYFRMLVIPADFSAKLEKKAAQELQFNKDSQADLKAGAVADTKISQAIVKLLAELIMYGNRDMKDFFAARSPFHDLVTGQDAPARRHHHQGALGVRPYDPRHPGAVRDDDGSDLRRHLGDGRPEKAGAGAHSLFVGVLRRAFRRQVPRAAC